MVDPKKSRIGRRATQPPAADEWVQQGGLDPDAIPSPSSHAEPPQPSSSTKKTYPHRLSADFDSSQYKRLKRAAFEEDKPMTEIVRQAVEDWLNAQGH